LEAQMMVVRSLMCAGALAALLAGAACGKEGSTVGQLLKEFRAVDWGSRAKMQKEDPADDAWRIRVETEHALIRTGAAAVPGLIEALEDKDKHVRGVAALCLGAIGDRRALPALQECLAHDDSSTVRLYAAEALGRLGDSKAENALTAALEDDNRNVVFAAKTARERLVNGPECGSAVRDATHPAEDFGQLAAPKVGEAAPEIDLLSSEGERVRLSSFRGKQDVVVLFQLADW
jgi:hypothetical protein